MKRPPTPVAGKALDITDGKSRTISECTKCPFHGALALQDTCWLDESIDLEAFRLGFDGTVDTNFPDKCPLPNCVDEYHFVVPGWGEHLIAKAGGKCSKCFLRQHGRCLAPVSDDFPACDGQFRRDLKPHHWVLDPAFPAPPPREP